MEIVFDLVVLPILFVLMAVVIYARLSQLFPGPARRISRIAVWITMNIFPSFWRRLDRPVGFIRARILGWYTADPAVQRGDAERPEGPINFD